MQSGVCRLRRGGQQPVIARSEATVVVAMVGRRRPAQVVAGNAPPTVPPIVVGVGTAAASQVDHQRVIPVPADRRPTRRGVGAGDAGSELLHSVECQHAQASGPE